MSNEQPPDPWTVPPPPAPEAPDAAVAPQAEAPHPPAPGEAPTAPVYQVPQSPPAPTAFTVPSAPAAPPATEVSGVPPFGSADPGTVPTQAFPTTDPYGAPVPGPAPAPPYGSPYGVSGSPYSTPGGDPLPTTPEPAMPPPPPPGLGPAPYGSPYGTSPYGAGAPVPPPPAYPGGYAAPGYAPGYPAYGYAAPQQTSQNAVIALVLSIVSWVLCPILPAVIALFLAGSARREIDASGGRIGGAGMVTAAKVISWLNIALMLVFIALWVVLMAIGFFAVATVPSITTVPTPTFSFG